MSVPETEVRGKWERAVRPMTDRLEMAGKWGLDVRFNADATKAHADVMLCLARALDLQDAYDMRNRNLRSFSWQFAALVALLAVAAWAA